MNNEYRQSLMKNTNTIMKNNFKNVYQTTYQSISSQNVKSYPYLFNGINDDKRPYGYESSEPKNIYLNNEKIENSKRIPLQNEI